MPGVEAVLSDRWLLLFLRAEIPAWLVAVAVLSSLLLPSKNYIVARG